MEKNISSELLLFITEYKKLKDYSAPYLLFSIFISLLIWCGVVFYFELPIRAFFLFSGLTSIFLVFLSVFSLNRSNYNMVKNNAPNIFNLDHNYSNKKTKKIINIFNNLNKKDQMIIIDNQSSLIVFDFSFLS